MKAENIAVKRGYLKLHPDYVSKWKEEIRQSRDADLRDCDDFLKSAYRADAKELLSFATKLKKGGKIQDLARIPDEMDTMVREMIPDDVWNLLDKD